MHEKVKKVVEESNEYFTALSGVSEISYTDENQIDQCVETILEGAKFFLPLDDLVDYNKEYERLSREVKKLETEVLRAKGKLSNEGFVAKAPAKLIEEEKEKLAKFEQILEQTKDSLSKVEEKLKV